ncbi:GNAT family N-acetyltransferase [Leucothrix arctica]|uniref:GNAT family N-acetyltransferase n=1 Tax=Leucothrix arctica TaxID=1481894 RepID=UPI001304ECD9|nr:GNAT family N-acetyltransferase [Leucothrix arctica]
MESKIRVECVQDTAAFNALKGDWNTLVEHSIHPQPFILWEWMFTWWEVYQQSGYELLILGVYDDKKLVAIAPFYIDNAHWLMRRRLRMLGEGEAREDEVVSHYPDVIALASHRQQTTDALVDYLLSNEKKWTLGQFRFMLGGSLLNEMQQKLSKAFDHYTVSSSQSYAIQLPTTPEGYVNSLSRSMRKQFRSRLTRMENSGELKIISAHEFDDPHEAMDILERLHRARWQGRDSSSIFDSTAFKTFHKILLNRLLDQGIIDIRVMYHNGEAIAAVHNFNFKKRCYSYQSGFSSQDDKRFSPMVVFDILEIQALVSAGYLEYDYLSAEGDNSYKAKFKCESEPVYETLWLKRGWQSILMRSYRRTRSFGGRYYRSLKQVDLNGLVNSIMEFPKRALHR